MLYTLLDLKNRHFVAQMMEANNIILYFLGFNKSNSLPKVDINDILLHAAPN